MPRSLKKMSQKEFFVFLKDKMVGCINSELENPHSHFIFSETPPTEYKNKLIILRNKFEELDFDVCPTHYVMTVLGFFEFANDANPVLLADYYQFIQPRFDCHLRITACIMRDISPFNRFNYLNLIEPEVVSPQLVNYIQEKISPDDYQTTLDGLRDPDQAPEPYQYRLLELIMLFMANNSNDAEIKKIIGVSFNVFGDEEICRTTNELLEAFSKTRKLIENASNQMGENNLDFEKMKSVGIITLIKGIEHFGKKLHDTGGLTEEDAKSVRKLKKLCTLLAERKNIDNEKDQIAIVGIINYILQNNFGDFYHEKNGILPFMTDKFNALLNKFASTDLQALEEALSDSKRPHLPHRFFPSDNDDDSGPPLDKGGTPPPSARQK